MAETPESRSVDTASSATTIRHARVRHAIVFQMLHDTGWARHMTPAELAYECRRPPRRARPEGSDHLGFLGRSTTWVAGLRRFAGSVLSVRLGL